MGEVTEEGGVVGGRGAEILLFEVHWRRERASPATGRTGSSGMELGFVGQPGYGRLLARCFHSKTL